MIIEKYKAFFIHIPKTGGHTVSAVLGGFHQNRTIKHGRHIDPNRYAELYPKEWGSYYKFTFVRNPWDRFISFFSSRTHGSNLREDDALFMEVKDQFTSFVKSLQKERNTHIKFTPQTRWLLSNGTSYPIDFIGRVENFDNDMNTVLSELNLPIHETFRRMFPSKRRRDYHEYYIDETAEIIANIYKEDIEYLNYSF